MDEEKPKKIEWNHLWKIVALILIGFVIGVFVVHRGWAYDETKWQVCSGINITGGACDDFWTHLVGQVAENNTLNETQIISLIGGAYYNKTQVDLLFGNISLNNTDYMTKTEFIQARNNFTEGFYTKSDVDLLLQNQKTSTSSGFDLSGTTIMLILAALVIAFLVFKDKIMPKKNQKTATTDSKVEDLMRKRMELNKAENEVLKEEK